MRRFYFDYAASTPLDPVVLREIHFGLKNNFGNPSSLHYFGQSAMAFIDKSREKIANLIGADFREVVFTGSATEANNLALRGVFKNFKAQKVCKFRFRPRIIISAVEHESILETARDLENEGTEVIYVKVDKNGVINLRFLEKALNEKTILVSIMYVNNETGVIQPITEISGIIRNFREEVRKKYLKLGHKSSSCHSFLDGPFFHTDAVQAFQYLDCNVDNLGVDLLTLSAHKIYGPKGIGLLYIRNGKHAPSNGQRLAPIITGGGQEFGLRSGTENTALAAGFAKAVELTEKARKKETKRIGQLSKIFLKELSRIFPKAKLNAAAAEKIPAILNISFVGLQAEDLLIKFDLAGIAVSRGAACMARSSQSSYVLKKMGLSEDERNSSLRFSFGKFTTKKEIVFALKIMKKILK